MGDSKQLSLFDPTKVEISPIYLKLKTDLTEQEYHDVFVALGHAHGNTLIWIGDLANEAEIRNGVKAEFYDDVAEETGLKRNTIRHAKWVTGRVDLSNRLDRLTFLHYQIVAPMEENDQKYWLEEAVKYGLSAAKLKKAIRESRPVEELPKDVFNIIYADPPWAYEKDQEYFGQDVERHYPSMSEDQLKNMSIKDIRADDCVLYLWATAPKLDVAMRILEAWGFRYKTCLIWDKVEHNMGFYASIRHEILLIGGCGQSSPTDQSYANQTDSVYVEERTEHSRKPEYYYEMIERMHPRKTKRIELFATSERDGWISWGNAI